MLSNLYNVDVFVVVVVVVLFTFNIVTVRNCTIGPSKISVLIDFDACFPVL